MAILRSRRGNTSRSGTANTPMEPVESPTLESLSENRQTPSYVTVDLPSREVPSKVPPALESLYKDQPAPEGLSEDRQPAEDPTMDLPAREVSKDLPAVASPSKDPPSTKGPSEDPKPAEDLTVTPPTGEIPSKTPSPKESSTTPPQLKSPSESQPTTEVQAGDRQTAEGPTTNQQAEKAPEDTPASESLPNGQSTTECPTTNLPDGEIPKEPTESSSQGESTAERPSEDLATEGPPTTPTVKALPSSGELSDVPMANSDQEHQKDFPSNPPSSDTIKEPSQRTNYEVNGQKMGKSRKRLRFAPSEKDRIIDLTDLTDSEEESKRCESSPSPEFEIAGGFYNFGPTPKQRRATTPTGDTNLPDLAPANSPTGSTKASEDEPNGRRKANPRTKVTSRELNGYVDVEMSWLDTALSRCRKINQHIKTHNELMASVEALNTEIDRKVGQVSANAFLQQKIRLEIGEEMKRLEKDRRELIAKQFQAVRDMVMEAASMEQNLQRWHGQESKFTKRIEKSR
ncbi:hypothetical protein ACEPPN_015337 [Leptodophora sp. 'Broadleaf-Isolate-01']